MNLTRTIKPITLFKQLTRSYSYIFFFILINLIHSFSLSAQMRQIHLDADEFNDINKISFYTGSNGYVAFSKWIGYTTDSGRTYQQKFITLNNVDFNGYTVNVTFGFAINGVKAFNQDTVIAYGHYGLVPAILYSTNGANNFKLIYHSQFDPLQLRTGITDMVFPQNTNIGYAVDADRILKTTDKGLTWQTSRTESGAYFDNLEATDNNTVFAIGRTQTSRVRKTFNGGDAWSVLNLPAGTVDYLSFLNYDKGWISMNNTSGGSLYYTVNSGQSWTLKTNNMVQPFSCEKMKFINDSTGLAIVYPYKTYKTTDSGRVWQQLPRDNNYSYLGYNHYDLHIRNIDQFWAGGGHGFLELTNNGGGIPIPAALFLVDTVGLYQTNTVQLINYSKSGNQYAWYVNSVFISSSYNTSYTHDLYTATDTVMLVVSNGTYSDTAYKYPQFNALPYPPPQVISFTPTSGGPGTVVTITGNFFLNASAVKFGGIPASSFTLNSLHQITAVVGEGANGAVSVTTPKGTGSLPGFITYPPPKITSFSPTSGPIGTIVTINGNNFNTTPSNNIVYFGPVKAQVLTAAGNQLTVAVPTGTTYEPITVTVNRHIAYSNLRFTVTFPAPCNFTGYTFEEGKSFLVGQIFNNLFSKQFAVSDIDGDGKSDIMFVNQFGFSVSRNTSVPGIVSFAPVVIFNSTTAQETTGTVAADIDGDGKKDVVITNPNGRTVSIFKNTSTVGTISFETKIDYPLAGHPGSICFNDLDGDGKADMIINRDSTNVNLISIFRNISLNGNIAFEPKIDISCGLADRRVSPADLDGDGKPDLVIHDIRVNVPGEPPNIYTVYRNASSIGTIAFDAFQFFPHYTYSHEIGGILDSDGDGKLDIFLGYDVLGTPSPPGSIAISRNTSSVGNITLAPPSGIYVSSFNRDVAFGDFDGDGKVDIYSDGALIKNYGIPGDDSLRVTGSIGNGVGNVAVADIDGDSKPDAIHNIYVFRNKLGERGAWAGKDTTICMGQTVGLGVYNYAPGYTFSWTSNPAGFTSTTSDPLVNPSVTTKYYLSVTNPQGCITNDTITVTLGGSAPIANAGPDANICVGSSIQLGTAASGSNTYSWTSDPTGFTSTLANPVVTPTTTYTTYYLSVNSGTCIAKDTVLISAWGYPTANAGPDKSICAGSPTTIGIADPNSNSLYSWTSNPQGFTSTLQTPLVNPPATTTYFLQVTNFANCIRRDTVVVTVNPQPAMPVVSASGPLTFCSGGSVTLTSSVSPNYQWYKNGVQISGATNQTLVVTESGDYKVSTVIGLCPASSLLTTVTVNSSSLPTIIAGGPLSFCQGLTVILTSSAPSNNQWYKDGVIISGATNQSLIVSTSGSYTVSTTTGCAGTSLPVTVTVSAAANAPVVTAGGPTTFCQGANVTLSSSAATGNQWYKDGNTINGATNQTFIATLSGNYSAKVINGGCASPASNLVSVNVSAPPPMPVITQNGNVLTSSAALGNQWYLNGNAIAGATLNTFTAQTSGVYTVNVTINGCTSSLSAGLNVVVTAINSPDLNKKITIFPLPAHDYLFIKYSATGGSFTVNLFDASGKKLFANGKFSSTYQLDLREYSSGLYVVQIINTRNGEQMRRLVVKL